MDFFHPVTDGSLESAFGGRIRGKLLRTATKIAVLGKKQMRLSKVQASVWA
jgi:hypothetical protein